VDAAADTDEVRARVFGRHLRQAEAFCARLGAEGVTRGVIGPGETGRLWERHMLNSALVAELLPEGARVLDVGSGAGLPGIPLVLARPDLRMTLLEPMQRRVAWLAEAVALAGRDVTVIRGRAEEPHVRETCAGQDVVVSRALAALDRVALWSLPLTAVGGRVIAIKGRAATAEVAEHRAEIARLGGGEPSVVECGRGLASQTSTAVTFARVSAPAMFHVKPAGPRRRSA
jgi:16S rRNA (guanine527-N7)-methyltransferase